ncbi:MAG: universal stress protein [Sphingopyxis sp.]
MAQRFAARRAAQTLGNVHLVTVIEQQPFVAWGGVQATIEEEARQRAEAMAHAAAAALHDEFGLHAQISVLQGAAQDAVRALLDDGGDVAALVLGAAASGPPGPLVTHFTGQDAGTLPVPVMIVPGSLTADQLDRIS